MTRFCMNPQFKKLLMGFGLGCTCALAVHAQSPSKTNEGGGAGRGFTIPGSELAKHSNPPASQGLYPQGSEKSYNLPPVAPAPKLPSVAAMPMSKTPIDTDSAINPMTGKSFSEERLTRLLNANKLVTDIARQQVAQAQLQTELELTGDRRQAEAAKIRSEVINVIPKTLVPTRDSLKAGEELVPGAARRSANVDAANLSSASPAPQGTAPVSVPVVQEAASGSIRIGRDTLQAQSAYQGNPARIVYVDAQAVGAKSSSPGTAAMPGIAPIASQPNAINANVINTTPYPPNFVPSPLQR